ncbi:aldo/keto reductase [Marivirga atlantica]|jgi:alcohol dehydrogenase (NADP+)|uniref:Aldo/keto reductase n=1 Tax=Marivirga atlantica TaxID=1548457 RepID=A0A937AK10_9BACT|nr:aldo/keto reductase [Marivirga atlantica]MBL0764983.1 aldo/keto reductase [Marivirga atlantica]
MEFTFKNNDTIPALGLGTWKSEEGKVYEAVLSALKAGYKHIDCALIYGNEKEIGNAFAKAFEDGIVKREELFVTSKLWNNAHKKADVRPALQQTLNDLQLDYLDLYLMHWPVALKPDVMFPKSPDDFLSLEEAPLEETWAAMEEVQSDGLAKHIGVANFNESNLKTLMNKGKVVPEMNQIELHPCLAQEELVAFCKKNDILVTAYSPLGSKDRADQMKKDDEPNLFELDAVKEIANKHDKHPVEILLAWAINRGTITIPKSTDEAHIKSNLAAADIKLSDEEVKAIAQANKDYRFVDGSFWAMDGSPYSMEFMWGK